MKIDADRMCKLLAMATDSEDWYAISDPGGSYVDFQYEHPVYIGSGLSVMFNAEDGRPEGTVKVFIESSVLEGDHEIDEMINGLNDLKYLARKVRQSLGVYL